jgi:hypothetical protein
MDPVNLLCVEGRTRHSHDYVNKLRAMVGLNMSRPYRFVSLTDDTTGIDRHIETRPLPPIGIPEFDTATGLTPMHGWLRVSVFAAPPYDLTGPTLLMDEDFMITGPLDMFFDPSGDFIAIKTWHRRNKTGRTSRVRYHAATHGCPFTYLAQYLTSTRRDCRHKWTFVTSYFSRLGTLGHWPNAWCGKFKRHCLHRGLIEAFKPARIADRAKVVAFLCKPNPPDDRGQRLMISPHASYSLG